MGLDFSHADTSWAYGSFYVFRINLANEIGMDLQEMEGFKKGCKGLSWDGFNDDIIPLLNHSDCDGELTVEECKKVAPRLRELVANWDDTDFHKSRALKLADGMDLAVKANEPLVFC